MSEKYKEENISDPDKELSGKELGYVAFSGKKSGDHRCEYDDDYAVKAGDCAEYDGAVPAVDHTHFKRHQEGILMICRVIQSHSQHEDDYYPVLF